MKRTILALGIVVLTMSACGKNEHPTKVERPDPPSFAAQGNAPAPEVAIDFMNKYSAVAQAAIDRTPYNVKDPVEQAKVAQELYRTDGDYLMRWVDSGLALFTAADIETCKLFVHSVFATWKTAYPRNGPVSRADMEQKQTFATYSKEKAEQCKHHLELPMYRAQASGK